MDYGGLIKQNFHAVPNCYRTQIPNFHLEMLLKLGAEPMKMLIVNFFKAKY